MEYKEFERIMSRKRMGRYLAACQGDTRKAMTLYRYNLHLTQDVFTVISCFGFKTERIRGCAFYVFMQINNGLFS